MFPSDVCDYIPRTVEEWVINIPSMLDARVAISMVDREDADVALGKTYLEHCLSCYFAKMWLFNLRSFFI